MDIDLKDQIAQVLSPDVARQLASTVGMDDRQGKTFVDAAIPSLLAAFIGAVERPDAAKALSDAVSNSDPNIVERLRRALAVRDLQPLSDGANALTPVLGQGVRDQLANGLADLVDTPIEAAMPALGAVEQAAIAVVGQQDPSLWSDPDAIKALMLSQKSAVLSALPASLSGLIGAAPPPSDPAPTTISAAPPPLTPAPEASRPAPPPLRSAPPPPPPPPPPSGGATWLIALIIILILAAGGYYYWSKSQEKPAAGALPSLAKYTRLESVRSVQDLA